MLSHIWDCVILFLLISTYCSKAYEMPDFEFVLLQDVFFDTKNILPPSPLGKSFASQLGGFLQKGETSIMKNESENMK